MTTSPKRLTLEQRVQVACYHSFGSKHPLWQVIEGVPGVVCCHCRKPSPDVVFRICAECDNEFVLPRDDPKWKPKMAFLSDGRLIENTFYCKPCY